jgi:hypothetical protein
MTDAPTAQRISDDEVLYRRIRPEQLVPDPQASTGWRVASSAWDDAEDDPSVYSESRLQVAGDPVDLLLLGHAGYTVATITAEQVRQQSPKQAKRGIQLDVVHRPDPEDETAQRGAAHCAITGFPPENAARKDARAPLARNCAIVRLGETPS